MRSQLIVFSRVSEGKSQLRTDARGGDIRRQKKQVRDSDYNLQIILYKSVDSIIDDSNQFNAKSR